MRALYSLFFLVLAILPASILKAQDAASVIVFDKTLHDFGDLRISDGEQNHVFTFTNKSDKPVIIQTVISSCGCTVPNWSHKPVAPGKTGTVTATFLNNQGALPFDKSLSVYTSMSDKPIMLRIRGVVHAKKFTVEETHPIAIGSLRLRKNVLELGLVNQGSIKEDSTEVINTGKTTVELSAKMEAGPAKIKMRPERLAAGAKGVIIYSIDASDGKNWGAIKTKGQLLINGAAVKGNDLSVNGNIKMDTRNLTPEQKSQAAVPSLKNSSFNFYAVTQGKIINTMFSLSNRGQSPLIIHKIDYSHSGIKAELPMSLEPGEQATIKVSVNRPSDLGEVVYTVSLITNAPSRPVINLLVYGTFLE